jgi:cytochrome c oxidase subunit 1
VFFINMVVSVRKGEIAVPNPWKSRSLEFQLPSPIPAHNYHEAPEVVGEPYDYGKPDADYVKMHPSSAPAAAD